MTHIIFITDVRKGEADILQSVASQPLIIRDSNKEVICEIAAPADGWTHEKLCCVEFNTDEIADAYLGEQWVGSTEV